MPRDPSVRDGRLDRASGFGIVMAIAKAAVPKQRTQFDEGFRNLLTGVELTERQMIEAFSRHGLTRVGAKGEVFDPKVHQAVAQAPSEHAQGTVLEVLQSGYVLGDRTLRAAMVLVSAGPAASAQTVDIKV